MLQGMGTRVPLSSASPDHRKYSFGQGNTASLASLARRRSNLPWMMASRGAWKPWLCSPSCATSQGTLGVTEGECRETTETEALGVTETGRFSVSDETLFARGFKLHGTLQGINLDQLNDLFVKVGFPRRHKQKLERALQHTSSICWLQEDVL